MKKLLILESSSAIAAVLTRGLSNKCQVHICHNSEDALAQIQTLRPDILFLDLTLLPWGFDLLGQTSFRPPVCIARTNILTDKVIAGAEKTGIRHLFPIPCTPQALTDCIRQYL